jgi:ABC-type amino acid transport substrate-binding protein
MLGLSTHNVVNNTKELRSLNEINHENLISIDMTKSNRGITIRYVIITVFLLHLLLPITLFAQQTIFNVDLYDSSPWAFLNDEGDLVGLMPDKYDKIAKETGFKFKYTRVNVARINEHFKTGKSDLTILFKDNQPPNSIIIGTTGRSGQGFIGRKGDLIDQWEDLEGKTIGLVRGAPNAIPERINYKRIEFRNDEQAVKLLFNKRVFAIYWFDSMYHAAQRVGYHKNMFSEVFVTSEQILHLFLSKNSLQRHEKNIPKLRAAVKKLYENGEFKKIDDKWINIQ